MNRTMNSAVRFVALLAMSLAFCAFSPQSYAQQSEPSIVNASFEDGFTCRGAPEVEVAQGWEVSWLEGDHPFCRHPCHRPEFKPETQTQYVTSGDYSQRWFSTFARQFGVVWQRVDVTPGEWYRFSCDAYVISEPPGGHSAFVGIQPWGAGVFARQMVWGQELSATGGWQRVEVVAQAWREEIVVGLGASNAWSTRNNTAYFDNCRIERVELDGECPECPPCPECPDGEGCDYEAIGEVLRSVLESLSWRAE